ncbi:MAG: DMT family transporter [Cyanobacteria bacterium P01_G01_bin.54]
MNSLNPTQNRQTLIPPLLLPLIASALFAGSFVAGKYTTADLQPLTTTLLRYLVTLAFLGGLVTLRGTHLQVARSDWLPMAAMSLLGVVGYHYFFFTSLRYTAVTNSAIINATNPVITSLLAALLIGERLRSRNYLGGLLAFLGVVYLLVQGQLQDLLGLQINLGDGLMLCAVLCWVGYSLILKRLAARYSGLALTFYAALFGVFFLLILAIPEQPLTQIQTISTASVWGVLYMGIGASGLGYLQYNLTVIALGATRASCYIYSCVPLFVALFSWLFFRHPLTAVMGISMVLIVAGLNLMLDER